MSEFTKEELEQLAKRDTNPLGIRDLAAELLATREEYEQLKNRYNDAIDDLAAVREELQELRNDYRKGLEAK